MRYLVFIEKEPHKWEAIALNNGGLYTPIEAESPKALVQTVISHHWLKKNYQFLVLADDGTYTRHRSLVKVEVE